MDSIHPHNVGGDFVVAEKYTSPIGRFFNAFYKFYERRKEVIHMHEKGKNIGRRAFTWRMARELVGFAQNPVKKLTEAGVTPEEPAIDRFEVFKGQLPRDRPVTVEGNAVIREDDHGIKYYGAEITAVDAGETVIYEENFVSCDPCYDPDIGIYPLLDKLMPVKHILTVDRMLDQFSNWENVTIVRKVSGQEMDYSTYEDFLDVVGRTITPFPRNIE